MRLSVGLLVICMATSALAQPDRAQSLVMCAQFVDSNNRWFPDRLDRPAGQVLAQLSKSFMQAAWVAAEQAGTADVPAFLTAEAQQMIDFWDAKGAPFLLTPEAKAWGQYCRKLGNDAGVSFDF